MSFKQTALREIKTLGLLTLYFAFWFGMMILVRRLILAKYEIEVRGVSLALIGAITVAKVVLVMEHVSLGRWVSRRPVAVDLVLRTLLYTLGVLIAVLLEKAFEARHKAGGFGRALAMVFEQRSIQSTWATTICVSGALFGFNFLTVVRRHFGATALRRLFFATPLAELEAEETRRAGVATAKGPR